MRVFINDIAVRILRPTELVELGVDVERIRYDDFDVSIRGDVYVEGLKQKDLRKILMEMEDAKHVDVKSLILRLRKDVDPASAILKKDFKLIEAGGGLVERGNETLYIYRLGRWDLPKGKLEKGETIEEGALREIHEECNVEASITNHVGNTYHVHKRKGRYVFKRTFWYKMQVIGNPELIPQVKEGIEDVRWMTEQEAKNLVYDSTYVSLRGLLDTYFSRKK